MMKKTLIALALAATTVSGSAMAWSSEGAGGTMTLGGTATPPAQVSVWEVLMGKEVTGLDMQIAKGVKYTSMTTTDAIPVIGIRTIANTPFLGGPGLSPKVSFGGVADFSTTVNGVTTATLDIKEGVKKIGTVKIPLFTAAVASYINRWASLYAEKSTDGFFGGLATTSGGAVQTQADAAGKLAIINPELSDNFDSQGSQLSDKAVLSGFNTVGQTFSGYYGAGILPGSNIVINLDAGKKVGTTSWSASLPVSVTYQ